MIFGAWILGLALLVLLFQKYLDNEQNPNRQVETRLTDQGVREIVLKRNRYGHYVASGEINGHTVTFLLDTGASTISIPARVARRLGLREGLPYQVSTANGTATVYSTRLQTLSLGNIVVHDLRAHINPHMDEEEILLGMSVLKNLEMTQRGDTLTLRQYGAPQ